MGRGNVAIAERPEPVAAPGHVILDVVAAGVCGTDLHIHDGEYPVVPPVTMGHEVSGVVASLGADALLSGLAPWAHVVAVTRAAHARMSRSSIGRDRIDDLSDMDVG